MKKSFSFLLALIALTACNGQKAQPLTAATDTDTINTQTTMQTVYDYTVLDPKGQPVSLADYRGKVLLIVNTATRCGFTPQYEELERLYADYRDRGFEILDFPCNQFGQQAPESDEEIAQFCSLNYNTEFPRFKKIEVNGEGADPLFVFLKSQKGFAGFDMEHKIGPILDKMMSKADSAYKENPDIKWNFTKFLVNRKGEVVARFEPTATATTLAPAIESEL